MKWYNAEKDELPSHNEEVLISVNGVYYITVYNRTEDHFYLKEQPDTFFSVGHVPIYWTQFENPTERSDSVSSLQVAGN